MILKNQKNQSLQSLKFLIKDKVKSFSTHGIEKLKLMKFKVVNKVETSSTHGLEKLKLIKFKVDNKVKSSSTHGISWVDGSMELLGAGNFSFSKSREVLLEVVEEVLLAEEKRRRLMLGTAKLEGV